MNILIISFLAVASLSTFPTRSYGSTEVKDLSKTVAAAEAVQPINDNGLKEIWQEDDREVLIRNERGAKKDGNNSGAAGKKGKKDKKNKFNKFEKPQPDTKQTDPNQTSSCRYVKGPWTECDAKTNQRSRTLTLKKGSAECVQTRTIQKKCKKACRYEKGAWSECAPTGQMTRTDKLKQASDSTCQTTRTVNKNCNQGKSNKDKQNKPSKKGSNDKGNRKNRQ